MPILLTKKQTAMKYKKGQLISVQYLNAGQEMHYPIYAYITKLIKDGFYYKSYKKPVFLAYSSIDKQNEYNITVKVEIQA